RFTQPKSDYFTKKTESIKMKIGILCYPTYGGSGIVATELGMALAYKGYEVHFISSNLPARLDITNPNIFFHKVNVQTNKLFKAQLLVPCAHVRVTNKEMLQREGIDIPLVATLLGTDITLVGQHPRYKHAVEFSINQSDTITSVSDCLKKDTLQFFNIKKENQ